MLGFDFARSPLQNELVGQLWHSTPVHESVLLSMSNLLVNSIQNVQLELPFLTDGPLQSIYDSQEGRIRSGKMLEDMDAIAVVTAYAYCKAQFENISFVTVSVKELQIPVFLSVRNYSIVGTVECQTNTTVWIRISLFAEGEQYFGGGLFCMAARDAKNSSPVQIVSPTLIRECPRGVPGRFIFGLQENKHFRVENRKIFMDNKEYLNIYGKIFGGYLLHEMFNSCIEAFTLSEESIVELNVNFKQPVELDQSLVWTKWKGADGWIYLESHSSHHENGPKVLCHEFEIKLLPTN